MGIFHVILALGLCMYTVNTAILPMHLTCQVEHEKLLHIGGEMVDFTEALIEEEYKTYEEEDRYNFSSVLRFLDVAREHNNMNMGREHSIIENPLAMFRLKRWLNMKWPPILEELEHSQIIDKRPELLQLLDDYRQFVGRLNIVDIVTEIKDLMYIYELPVHAVAMGSFGPRQIEALTPEEIFQMAETLNDLQDHRKALEWLLVGHKYCNNSVQMAGSMYYKNLLGATHLKLHQYDEALGIFKGILEEDANSRAAKSNLKLIEKKITQKKREPENTADDSYVKTIKKYCYDNLKFNQTQDVPLESRLVPIVGSTETVRVTELHRNPDVIMVFDVFDERRRRFLIEKSAQKLWNILTSKFQTRQATTQGSKVYFSKDRWWMEPYIVRMRNITYRQPVDFTKHINLLSWVQVVNNAAGMRDSLVRNKQAIPTTPFKKELIAHYYAFLEVPEYGGELVFPDLNLRIKPVEGAAVFYQFRTPHGPIHNRFLRTIHCPVLIGAQWNAKFYVQHNGLFQYLTI